MTYGNKLRKIRAYINVNPLHLKFDIFLRVCLHIICIYLCRYVGM